MSERIDTRKHSIQVLPSVEAAAEAAAANINQALAAHQNQQVLLLLSGGSALAVIKHIDSNLLSKQTTLAVADERFTTDPTENNFLQIESETGIFSAAELHGTCTVRSIPKEGESVAEFANRFAGALEQNKNTFVIALLGIGNAAHTAGIFPIDNFDEVFSPDKVVTAYEQNFKAPSARVTITPSFIRDRVGVGVFFAVGEEKRSEIITARDSNEVAKAPAAIYRKMSDATIYTDQTID